MSLYRQWQLCKWNTIPIIADTDPLPAGFLDLDLDHLSRQTFGDPELEDELLRLFDELAAQIVARLAAPSSTSPR